MIHKTEYLRPRLSCIIHILRELREVDGQSQNDENWELETSLNERTQIVTPWAPDRAQKSTLVECWDLCNSSKGLTLRLCQELKES